MYNLKYDLILKDKKYIFINWIFRINIDFSTSDFNDTEDIPSFKKVTHIILSSLFPNFNTNQDNLELSNKSYLEEINFKNLSPLKTNGKFPIINEMKEQKNYDDDQLENDNSSISLIEFNKDSDSSTYNKSIYFS